MSQYVTLNFDTDQYLFSFLNIKDLLIVAQLNHLINKLVHKLNFIEQYSKFKTSEGHYRLINFVCANGYVELLNQIYTSADKFIYDLDAILWATKNDHIQILEWYQEKNLNYDFDESNILVIYCLIYQRLNILNWLVKHKKINKYYVFYFKQSITYQYMFKTDNIIVESQIDIRFEILMASISGIVEVLDIINKNKNLKVYFEDENLFLIRNMIMHDRIQALEWVCVNYEDHVRNKIDEHILFSIFHNKFNIVRWLIQYELVRDRIYSFTDNDKIIEALRNKNQLNIIELLE